MTVLFGATTLAACAPGMRRFNVYVEASAGLASTSLDDERSLGPMIGAHLGVAKETEHSDGFNVHMGPGGVAFLEGTDVRAGLFMLTMHLDHTTSRTEDGSPIHRWATLLEGPALTIPGEPEADVTGAVSIASGPAREWRARNGLLAGASILARGMVGGRSAVAAGVELRFRIGIADRPRK